MQLSRQRISEEYCVYVCVQLLSCVYLFVIPWTAAHQAHLSVGFPRQEYWSGLPAISFSRGFSWSKDWTQVSCIGKWILYHWTTLEALWELKEW